MGRGQELLDAARNGDKRTVEKILGQITKRSGPFTSLRRGAGVNVQDDNGYTPLHHACLYGHKEIVRLLLAVDASPCIADKMGATPLHLAAWKGESSIVAMLLAHKNPPVNVDHLTNNRESALLAAAHFGYTDVVAQLMAKGADVSIRNINDESALDLAAQYGRLETVQHLIHVMPHIVDPYKMPKCRGKSFSTTPLHRASMNGRKDVVQVLLAAGVDPNIRTYNGATPLHEAACYGKASIVRMLLAHGADLNAVDRNGKSVHSMLALYSEEATRKVRRVIRDYENRSRMTTYESDEELPPFPVQDSPTSYPLPNIVKAPETQENTNKNKSFVHPSSSSQLTKNQSQSFVKKLASKYLGLKSKFNSAPNISNNSAQETEVDVKSKHSENKSSTNTLLIGNSKFFNKILSKKEESGEVVCTNEFDTISLDRISTLNRDSYINRSNRSCPGFKTSLPNISENNELSDKSIAESVVMTEIDCDKIKNNPKEINEAVNHKSLELRSNVQEKKRVSEISMDLAIVNECYESYEFLMEKDSGSVGSIANDNSIPKPPPRPNVNAINTNNDTIYENLVLKSQIARPTPAARTHLPTKIPLDELEKKVLYENVSLLKEKTPEAPKRTILTLSNEICNENERSLSRSSTLSSDSMIDETNLEDILLSQKSKSFKHGIHPAILRKRSKSNVSRTYSNSSSSSSNFTEASAIENVDCSGESNDKEIYLSMTGTLPTKKKQNPEKKVLFRHKTFTNMEVDRDSIKLKDLPKWNSDFLKDTLAHYHIRGTGHCIYNGPTVSEFIDVFNRDTLYKDVAPFTRVPNDKRDSYFETAICFCKPRPPKHHKSAEDLLEMLPQDEEETINIDWDALRKHREMNSTSFRCFCDSDTCTFHSEKRDAVNFVVKFSAIKKSISTPDITLNHSPSLTFRNSGLVKNNSVPFNLEEPYAVINVEDIVTRQKKSPVIVTDLDSPEYVCMMPSMLSTSSSSSSNRPYSLKDISEVMSLRSTSTTASLTHASDTNQIPLGKSSSEHSGHWSLQSCNSNITIQSDASFVTCLDDSDDSDGTLHSDDEISDSDTIKSNVSTGKRPWVHSDSFRFGANFKVDIDTIAEESSKEEGSSKFESGISLDDSDSSSSDDDGDDDENDSGVPRVDADVSLVASLERGLGVDGGVRSGSGRRRWDEAEGTSEGDALSVSSAASSCAPLHLAHHHEYSKVSPTPPKKPPRRNLSVSPTHANSPSSGYSYELRPHARSQDDLDDIQGAKHYLKHGRSVDQYVDGKLSYSEYEDNHNSPRIAPVPNPRPSLSLKNRSQPVAITAMYENVVIKEQNPRRKLRRNFGPQYENYEPRMNDNRVRKYSNQERSSLESLLDDQSMNSPSDCERYYDGPRGDIPLSPSHYEQPPTPDHPPPSAKQAENSIHERIRPLSQLIMEVVEEIRIRKKSQGDVASS